MKKPNIKAYNMALEKALAQSENAILELKITFPLLAEIKEKTGVNMYEVANIISDRTMLHVMSLSEKLTKMKNEDQAGEILEILNLNMSEVMDKRVGLLKAFEVANILFPESKEIDIDKPGEGLKAMKYVQKVNNEIMALIMEGMRDKIVGLKINEQEI